MKTLRMRKIGGAAAVACAAISVGLFSTRPAIAADPDETVQSVRVAYADLDLATARGAKALFMRLQDAAQEVCGDSFETVDLSERVEMQKCQQTAIENAVVQVDNPLLTTRYDQHYPREAIPDSRVSVRSAGLQGLEITARHG